MLGFKLTQYVPMIKANKATLAKIAFIELTCTFSRVVIPLTLECIKYGLSLALSVTYNWYNINWFI